VTYCEPDVSSSTPDTAPKTPETPPRESDAKRPVHFKRLIALIGVFAVVMGVGGAIIAAKLSTLAFPIRSTNYVRYLGVHESDAPGSYAQIDQFAASIGRQPNIVSYYGPWLEKFQAGFAAAAAKHGAITIVQMDPENVSIAAIADGRYDAYLRSYAAEVIAFGRPVVMSFGHEMNGNWYPWGNQNTPARTFVAAWRHIVTVFREAGATNVTWLWTVNVVDPANQIPNPSPWWPGKQYVNWVGIDGYFYLSETFSELFGPTIVDIRGLTGDPILIAETGADPSADQVAEVNQLFLGVRAYGLLGFVCFDENTEGRAWRIDSPTVFATLRRDANRYMRPSSTTDDGSP
jgi:mannan endo-1,4-beta-mannosidase